jgi:hypothetical protein
LENSLLLPLWEWPWMSPVISLSCYRGSICNFTYIPLSWSNGCSPFQNF